MQMPGCWIKNFPKRAQTTLTLLTMGIVRYFMPPANAVVMQPQGVIRKGVLILGLKGCHIISYWKMLSV